jgi:SAM-dependent methyltransferase
MDTRQYWESRLGSNSGLEGVGYLSLGPQYNEWLYRVRRKVFLREIKKLTTLGIATAEVLDVGSGTGFWIERWKEAGARSIIASDLTSVAVDRLRAKFADCKVVQFDVTAQQPLNQRFDIISAFDVLFHVIEEDAYDRAIANISRMLKSGGLFLYSDNFVKDGNVRAAHQVSRSLQRITSVLESNRFRVLRRLPMFVIMNAPVDASSIVPSFIWRAAMRPLQIWQSLGHVYGALLYPLELTLTSIAQESPTTELMICEKI